MEIWKSKFENALQKVNTAGRNLVSNVRTAISDIQELRNENKSWRNDENYYQNQHDSDEIEIDPCIECASDFGILTIVDEEDENFFSVERQNDREEIRRKLAMDSDTEDHLIDKRNSSQDSSVAVDRLKCGTNLQMCFFNEGAAKGKFNEEDANGAKSGDAMKTETVPQKPPLPRILKKNALFPPSLRKNTVNTAKPLNNNNTTETVTKRQRPASFFNRPRSWHAAKVEEKPYTTEDLFTCHQRLQEEAREALAQAKEMARMQMEIERQKKKKSPIADIVGISFPDGHNLLSRNSLLDMNVAQLQVIVNDLHSQIETLNEDLVKFLLERDDLHMEQDSMLVDIEDLTRYLGLKGNTSITQPSESKFSGDCVGSNKN